MNMINLEDVMMIMNVSIKANTDLLELYESPENRIKQEAKIEALKTAKDLILKITAQSSAKESA